MPVSIKHSQSTLDFSPITYKGSSHLNALANADALILIPAGTATVDNGQELDGQLL